MPEMCIRDRTQPGVNVHEGAYLLAVNGKQLHATDNLYAAFEGLAGKQTTITLSLIHI